MYGIAMINVDEFSLFSSNRSTLKETSKDDNGANAVVYMTESEIEVINFDKVKEGYVENLSVQGAASLDALAVFEDHIELIEFKNGCLEKRDKEKKEENICNKIRDSLLLFCDIANKNITYTREYVDFILVYNESKNPSAIAIAAHFTKKGGDEITHFGLGWLKGLYFRNVHTYTENQFKAYLGEG